jgi:hypothetical protein
MFNCVDFPFLHRRHVFLSSSIATTKLIFSSGFALMMTCILHPVTGLMALTDPVVAVAHNAPHPRLSEAAFLFAPSTASTSSTASTAFGRADAGASTVLVPATAATAKRSSIWARGTVSAGVAVVAPMFWTQRRADSVSGAWASLGGVLRVIADFYVPVMWNFPHVEERYRQTMCGRVTFQEIFDTCLYVLETACLVVYAHLRAYSVWRAGRLAIQELNVLETMHIVRYGLPSVEVPNPLSSSLVCAL